MVGAFCVRNTPSTIPARSTTATTISTFTEFTAAVTMLCTSEACIGGAGCVAGAGGGSGAPAAPLLLPPPQPVIINARSAATPSARATPKNRSCRRWPRAWLKASGFGGEWDFAWDTIGHFLSHKSAGPQWFLCEVRWKPGTEGDQYLRWLPKTVAPGCLILLCS